MDISQEAAILSVQSLSRQAIECNNLHMVFGSNGMSGRRATGNYTLVAAATGLSRKHVGMILKGKTEPSYTVLLRLSEVTGIGIDQISRYIQDQKNRKAA